MARKVILLTDPGIDGAFALALALHDPNLLVLGVAATAGNITADIATRNVQALVEQFDPPRIPRTGAAPNVEYEIDGTRLHGPGGLGGLTPPCARLHQPGPSDRLIIDLVRQEPREVTIIALGPLTVLARAFDRDPELPGLINSLICVGGTWHEPGNAGAVAEFHFYCDPAAAKQVLQCKIPTTLIPLDVTRRLVFSPKDLLDLPAPNSTTCQFLRQIASHGIRASSNLYGIEGFHLKDVLGVVAASLPGVLTSKSYPVDVETKGELTRGMLVIDSRPDHHRATHVEVSTHVDVQPVREHIKMVLQRTEHEHH